MKRIVRRTAPPVKRVTVPTAATWSVLGEIVKQNVQTVTGQSGQTEAATVIEIVVADVTGSAIVMPAVMRVVIVMRAEIVTRGATVIVAQSASEEQTARLERWKATGTASGTGTSVIVSVETVGVVNVICDKPGLCILFFHHQLHESASCSYCFFCLRVLGGLP